MEEERLAKKGVCIVGSWPISARAPRGAIGERGWSSSRGNRSERRCQSAEQWVFDTGVSHSPDRCGRPPVRDDGGSAGQECAGARKAGCQLSGSETAYRLEDNPSQLIQASRGHVLTGGRPWRNAGRWLIL